MLVPAAVAQAAPTGVNVSHLSNNGDPYVAPPGNLPGDPSDAGRTWQDLEESGAKLVRTFANWTRCPAPRATIEMRQVPPVHRQGGARGMRVLLTLTGDKHSMADPGAIRRGRRRPRDRAQGPHVAYEVWNEQDDTTSGRTARSRPPTPRC